MTIAPFSFREFGAGDVGAVVATNAQAKPFLPTGRNKKEEAAPPPPPPPPTFSEDDVKTAERDGYQKGFIDGIVEGKNQAENAQAKIELELSQMVESFSTQIAPLFSIYRGMLTEQAKLLPQIAHTIAKKVAGEALTQNAYASIEEICVRCVKAMLHEPKLVITLHDSMAKTLEEKIRSSSATLQVSGEITVIGDANIAPPNCRIEWKNGAMIRDTESLWQQVEQVVGSMVTSAEREVDALCNQLEQVVSQPPAPPQEQPPILQEQPPATEENE